MRTIILILTVFTISACDRIAGTKSPEDALDGEWKVYSTAEYSISYPVSWEFDISKENGTDFSLNAGREVPEDSFSENISLTIKDMSGLCLDLAVFTDMTLSQTKKNLKNAEFTEVKKLSNANGETESVVFSGEYKNLYLKWKQYYKIDGAKAYILTFAAEKHKFDSYHKLADKILNSFQLNKKVPAAQ